MQSLLLSTTSAAHLDEAPGGKEQEGPTTTFSKETSGFFSSNIEVSAKTVFEVSAKSSFTRAILISSRQGKASVKLIGGAFLPQ